MFAKLFSRLVTAEFIGRYFLSKVKTFIYCEFAARDKHP